MFSDQGAQGEIWLPTVKAIFGQLSTVTEMFEALSFVEFQGFRRCLRFLFCNDWNSKS